MGHVPDNKLIGLHWIMGDFNLDWLDQSVPPRMTAVLPGYRQLVTEMTTDCESALDHYIHRHSTR